MRPVPLDLLPPDLRSTPSNAVPLDLLPPELRGAITPRPEASSGFLRQVTDIPVGIAKGAVQGVGMLANLFGADTAAADSIKKAEGYLNQLLSAQARNDQQEIARIMEEAEGRGAAAEIKAALRAFATAPVDLLSQAAGTVVPTLLAALSAKVLGAGALVTTAVGAATGAGMGAGVVKGTIYEETKKALLDAGMSEAQAEARASLAQSYGGQNLDMILSGAAIGGVAATTGVEKAVIGPLSRRILGKSAAEEAAQQATQGMVRRAAGTAAAEAVPEFIQAGQEQLAANLALQREGFDQDLMSGVVGAGTLEALAGAGLGGIAGAVSRPTTPGAPVPPENLPPDLTAEPTLEPAVEPQGLPPVIQTTPPVEPPPALPVTPPVTPPAAPPTALVAPEDLEAGPPPFETTPIEQPPLPKPAAIEQTESDIQREVQRIQEIEARKPTKSNSLYEFLAYRPARDKKKDFTVDNRISNKDLIDIESERTKTGKIVPSKKLRFLGKEGGYTITDLISTQELNPWLPFELRFYGTEDADQRMEKESEAEDYIKEALRNREYITYETKLELQNINESLASLERTLYELTEEYESDEQRRQAIKDIITEIDAELESAAPEDFEPPAAGTEGDIGKPAGKAGAEIQSLSQAQTGQPFTYQGFRGKGKTAEEIYTGAKIPVAGPGRYIAISREDAGMFGDEITEEPVTLENPLVIRTDNEWRDLTRRAGWEFPNPFGLDEDTVRRYTDNLAKIATGDGYDGLVIDPSEVGDTAKTLRNVFGIPQIVDYRGAPQAESSPVQISPEEQKQEALDQFRSVLAIPVPRFKMIASNGRASILNPKPLTNAQINQIVKIANDAIELGMPASLLSKVTAGGSTRMDSQAGIGASTGWFMLGKQWASSSSVEQITTITHELGHTIDSDGKDFGLISKTAQWKDANEELRQWYERDSTIKNPLSYPFSSAFAKRIPDKRPESFAQAFALYFVSPVQLQTNAPTAYSAIQSIVEGIQNESTRTAATGAAAPTGTGVQVQQARIGKGPEVQPDAGQVGAAVGRDGRVEDRGTIKVDGKDRPTTNSEGRPIHPTVEGIRNFWRWFGDSEVVDEQGRPLVVYRGQRRDQGAESTDLRSRATPSFTDNKNVASVYSTTPSGDLGRNSFVYPAYIRMKRPLDLREYGSDPVILIDLLGDSGVYAKANDMEILGILNDLATQQFNTGFEYSNNEDLSLDEIVKEFHEASMGMDLDLDRMIELLGNTYIDPYAVADSKAFVGAIKKYSNFDGILIKDVLVEDLAQAAGVSEYDAYRPFNQTQIKSATGNIGTFGPSPSIVAEPEDKRRADLERDLFRLTPSGQMAPTAGVQGDLFGATGQLAPTPQLQRRKNSNTEQLSLYLDSDPDPSQPDSQDAKAAAVEAVEQLQETNNPLAMQLADELANRQVTMLVGKPARTPEDMAILAQVYRDNRFETTRLFFTDKDGKIVSQLGLTSRMPASAPGMLGSDVGMFFDSVTDAAKEKGATGYFMVHNHPSGSVQFSQADLELTQLYKNRFTQLKFEGHIVIDTNKYGVILPNGQVQEVAKDFGEKPFKGQEGEFGTVRTSDDIARLVKGLETNEGDITLLAVNIRGNVMQISTIPASVVNDPNKARLRRNIQKIVLRGRGRSLVAVGRDAEQLNKLSGLAENLIQVNPDGTIKSFNEYVDFRPGSIYRTGRDARVAGATSPEFNYLRTEYFRTPPMPGMAEPDTEDNPNVYPTRKNIWNQPVESSWGRQDESKLDTFIHFLQDKMIDVKRVQEQIRKAGKEITDRWNAYLKEELFHGRSAKKTKDFLFFELDPLMREMEKRGVGMAEFEEYLHNRTAETRNKLVAERDPDNYPDGGSGILTADAQEYLDGLDSKKKADYEALADMVDKITKKTRQLLVDSGHESAETIAAWEKSLPFYVPLNRAESDYELSNMGTGVGQGFAVRGKFARSVVGSDRPVVDILANIAMQRERAIVRTEKMRVGQALYGLVLQSPKPDFWLPVDPEAQANPKDIESITRTLLGMGFTPFSPEVTNLQNLMQALMRQPTLRKVDASTNTVVSAVNEAMVKSPYALPVRINGVDKYIFFNPQDPIAARMAKSLRNVDADQMDKALGPIAKVTRYFAAINTQYNPIFGVINFMRDAQGALIQLSSTPLAGKQKDVMAKVMPALRGIYADLRARRGNEVATGEYVDLWNRFQDLGGQTGFRDQFSRSDERADALYAVMNPSAWTETTLGKIFTANGKLKVPLETARKSVAKPIFDWLTDYNETMENAIRLAAFKTALDSGMTDEQAASVAKNLTVNFNRKGLIGKQAGALYAFFNASVQGTARMAQTLFTKEDGKISLSKTGKTIFYGGLLLGSAQAMLLAAAGFDEEEPPEFIKERNIVIPLPGGKYVTIPMPLGYNVIPTTGRIMTEWAMSGFKDTPRRIADLTGAMLEMFNPVGNAGWSWQTFSPTLADPAVALFENRDWTGKPIAKQDFSSLDPTPGYTRARETASWFSKNLSEFLNLATGGTKDTPGLVSPTPDQIDYLIGQLTGGVGRELLKAEQTVTSTFTGEELPAYKVPLVGRFVGDTTGQAAVRNKFYANLTELNLHQRSIEGRRDRGENVQEYFRENPEARLYKMGDKIQRNVSQLRKRREMLLEKGASKDQIKAIENQITLQMQRLNESVEKVKK